jgi:hypothetical protein
MEIFGFANALGTGLQLLAASQGSKVPSLGDGAGSVAEGIGFATKLARTFRSAQSGSAGKYGAVPFQQTASIQEPEGYYSMFGKPSASLSTPQAMQRPQLDIPRLYTAVNNLRNNAQNEQMQQVMKVFGIQPTKAVNQPKTFVQTASLKALETG